MQPFVAKLKDYGMIAAMADGIDRLAGQAAEWGADTEAYERQVREHYAALTARLRSRDLLTERTEEIAVGLSQVLPNLDQIVVPDDKEDAHMEFFVRLVVALRGEEHGDEVLETILAYARIDPADFDEATAPEKIAQLTARLEREQLIETTTELMVMSMLSDHGVIVTPGIRDVIETFVINARMLLMRDTGYTAAERQNMIEELIAMANRRRLPRLFPQLFTASFTALEQALQAGPRD